MHFDVVYDYPGEADRVAAMLADAEYLDSSARASGAVEATHEVHHDQDGAFTVSSVRRLPAETIPASMRTFVGATIELVMKQAWSAPDSDNERMATVTLDVTGAPAHSTARAWLTDAGDTSRIRHEWHVSAPMPLIGAAIEQALAKALREALDAEHSTALAYLAGP